MSHAPLGQYGMLDAKGNVQCTRSRERHRSTSPEYARDLNSAFEWLDLAYLQRDVGLVKMTSNPLLQRLRGDVRYDAILDKARLPN